MSRPRSLGAARVHAHAAAAAAAAAATAAVCSVMSGRVQRATINVDHHSAASRWPTVKSMTLQAKATLLIAVTISTQSVWNRYEVLSTA